MAFDEPQLIVRKLTASASVGARLPKGGGLRFAVGLSRDFVAEFPIKKGDCFVALIGRGEDTGKLRLARRKGAPIQARAMEKGGAAVNFTIREELVDVDQKKQGCAARVLDKDTIEIDLPAWAREDSGADTVLRLNVGAARQAALSRWATAAGQRIENYAAALLADLIDETLADETERAA